MAAGIMTALQLIKNNRLHNPLLFMITDGLPNAALWTMDAQADALEAATLLPSAKVRFICIGVEANVSFMEKLIQCGEGGLYLVDDLNQETLINLVRFEKRAIINSKYICN